MKKGDGQVKKKRGRAVGKEIGSGHDKTEGWKR